MQVVVCRAFVTRVDRPALLPIESPDFALRGRWLKGPVSNPSPRRLRPACSTAAPANAFLSAMQPVLAVVADLQAAMVPASLVTTEERFTLPALARAPGHLIGYLAFIFLAALPASAFPFLDLAARSAESRIIIGCGGPLLGLPGLLNGIDQRPMRAPVSHHDQRNIRGKRSEDHREYQDVGEAVPQSQGRFLKTRERLLVLLFAEFQPGYIEFGF